MKLAFITCEYNPMHKGHMYHLQKTKKDLGIDGVVLIMSGSTVQRGEFSIVDKYEKARLAIENGADLVIELPTPYVLSSANIFAKGAIKIASSINGENYFSFGSEVGDIDSITNIVNIKKDNKHSNSIRKMLDEGYGFVKSLSDSLIEIGANKEILCKPNNILGVEYISELQYQKSSLKPYTFKRNIHFKSSSYIRNRMDEGKKIKRFVPSNIYSTIKGNKLDMDAFYLILVNCIINQGKSGIKKILGVKEGLENLIYKAALVCNNYDEFLAMVKSKRYTLASIKRICINIVLEITKLPNISYLNILASNNSPVLPYLINNTKFKVIMKYSDISKLNENEKKLYELDQKAYRLQEVLLGCTNKDLNKKYNMRKIK